MIKKHENYGFTIVELLVVIVVIGILASITAISYTGIQSKAKDAVLLSSVNNMGTAQQLYAISNGTAGKNYQSSDGYDSDLGFRPSSNGEVIEVSVSSTGYCIRGYIAGGTKNSLSNAVTSESSTGICSQIPSSITSLSGLTISAGTISETFSSANLNYTATVPNGTTTITFTPTAQTVGSTIKINGASVLSGSASPQIPTNIGLNTIGIEIKSADGLMVSTYNISVTRNPSLSGLTMSLGTMNEALTQTVFNYTASVPNGTTQITITPTTSSAAIIKVNGVTVNSGTASQPIALTRGVNNIAILVTSSDGQLIQNYTLAVTRSS